MQGKKLKHNYNKKGRILLSAAPWQRHLFQHAEMSGCMQPRQRVHASKAASTEAYSVALLSLFIIVCRCCSSQLSVQSLGLVLTLQPQCTQQPQCLVFDGSTPSQADGRLLAGCLGRVVMHMRTRGSESRMERNARCYVGIGRVNTGGLPLP